ncbi:GH3 domain-containing protein [Larimichthys crocea]|uniref:Uncharacterized protein n=1 Tax=Larimichthys crocea TaxID=215358 RepID=A0ACD3RTA1_LARCR|nr:GH3 domain-containing protein [Larimichthys crocea]
MAVRWARVAVPLCVVVLSVVVSIIGPKQVMPPPLPAALGVCSLVGLTLLWRDISSKMKGENRTVSGLVGQYLAVKGLGWLGRRQRRKLEADTVNVKRAQEETLLRRMRKNANTCYGRQYDFSSIKDSDDFRARHPITTYEHYREFIQRIAAGEEKVIIAEKPLILAMTSGTSGPSAMLLSTSDTNTEFFLQMPCDKHFLQQTASSGPPSSSTLLHFASLRPVFPVGPNSSTPASSRHMLNLYTTPAPAFEVSSEKDTLYLHLLFALKDPSVGTLESNFASTVFYAFSALQDRWQELVEDIERGKVSSALVLEPKVRSRLEALMKPDPVDSGSNQIYGEMLRENYCQGVPFYSPFYAATEGLIGVNLWPQEANRRYMLCPRSMFCEFLPESSLEEETPHTLLMEDVKEGQSYELVITNASGLFRYRIGDIVKVVGFHNQCPVVEFQYRRGQMLSVRGEKVSEALFLDSLKKAVSQWPGAQLIDYCCAESGIMGDSIGGSDPHYQVFIELKGVRNLTEEQRYKLDICLQQNSAIYKSFRIKGSIGPMRVQLVAAGAFKELRKHMMAFSSTSPNTFKMHRVLRRKEYADFLLGKTVS